MTSREAPAGEPLPFELTGPLPDGVTVLEASAGTGKTYTLAALAARFIAEGAASLDELLIVTFTRAATSELRERVRERLVHTERALTLAGSGGASRTDADPVAEMLAQAPAEVVAERLERLAGALANFDAITIETTHGFCQNVLDGLGTLADSDPAARFTESVEELAREVVDDLYLRRFARQAEGVRITYDQARVVASAAIANPLETLHPLAADEDSTPAMRRRLAQAARAELEVRKRAQGLMTYDDQLTRLLVTLSGTHGEGAVASLRARFRVVLIDEFQDTDPTQWEIVRRAFGAETTLVLIGDPKQAIYAFRGADVHAYLAAARSAATRATLAVNHRSDQQLLDGLDALFGDARLGHPEIVYRRVRATAANTRPRLLGAPGDGALLIRLLEASEPAVRRTKGGGFPESGSARAHIARDVAAEASRLMSAGATVQRRDAAGEVTAVAPLQPGDLAILVRTHHHARMLKEVLDHVGLPAVINGSGSVFGTPAAQDWLWLLEALEAPSDRRRARTAALCAPIGWSAADLALADERELEGLEVLLHGWARTLREHGVAALVQEVMHRRDATARLLSVAGGERRLTDLAHIGQLLSAVSSTQPAGLASLTGWLRLRIGAADREGASDERTRRLDSDADAIQVLTFHRSKGLEFPVVYCPFLWEPGRLAADGEPVYFHADDGTRALDVGLEGAEYRAHLRRHNVEERDEELRLAYVALTRARHRAVVWWAGVWQARDSPLGRLLFARDGAGNVAPEGTRRPREDDARARFEQLAASAPGAVSVVAARHQWPPPASTYQGPPANRDPDALACARFERALDETWRRTSYSALTSVAHAAPVAAELEHGPISDEPWTAVERAPSDLPLAQMAAGPELGTLIHRVLERLDFAAPDLQAALLELLEGATRRRPELLGCSPTQAAAGLALALATPLGGERAGFSLSGVARGDRLDELSFELPLADSTRASASPRLADLAELMAELLPDSDPLSGYARRLREPQLGATLRGFLTGSIDLVLRVTGGDGRARYLIVDYKTNWLAGPGTPLSSAHYTEAALAAEMQRSHYVLQALLYSVALHRYLRWRLDGYDPERDLGGVRYLFLRGMTGGAGGVFAWHPPAGLVLAASDLLAGASRR